MAFNFLPNFNISTPKLEKKPVAPQVNPNPFAGLGLGKVFKKIGGFLNPKVPVSSQTANISSSMLPKLDFSKDSIVSSVAAPFKSYLGGKPAPSSFSAPVVPQFASNQFAGTPGTGAGFTGGINVNNQQRPPVVASSPKLPPIPVTSPQFEPAFTPVPTASVTQPDPNAIPEGTSSGQVFANQTGGSPSGSQVGGLDPNIQGAYDKASKAYEDSLKLSPDELSTQEDLDKIISSARQAFVNIEDKPIPMQFITGQLASVERRANVLAEPLERKLARLQAARIASVDASKFGLEKAEKRLAEEKAKAEGKVVGDSIVRYNPVTGKYDSIFSAPKKTEGFTLGEGQLRYDAEGNLIAAGPEKRADVKKNIVKIDGVDYMVDEEGNFTKPEVPTGPTAEKVEKADEVISKIDSLLNNKNLGKAVGPVSSQIPGFLRSGARNDVEAAIEALVAGVAIENLSLLKGPMSDKDVAFIKEASAGLKTNMSEEGFKNQLNKLKSKFQEIKAKAASGGGGETMDVNGSIYEKVDGGWRLKKADSSSSGQTSYLENFGRITGFGSPVWKPGLDVDLKKGDPVPSPTPFGGQVIFAGRNSGFGNQVKIRDHNGNEIWLSHLDAIPSGVKAGLKVSKDQLVGIGGNTGTVIRGPGGDGSHLDITIRDRNGKLFNAQQVAKYLS